MISPTIWRRSAATSLPCLKRRKSSKAFVRHVDEVGNPYYMLSRNKQERIPKSVSSQDLFKISNLLLDLDAEGSRVARPLDSKDEEQLSALWAIGPARKAAKKRVKEFRAQIRETRLKMDKMQSQRINGWRISPHDILATAFHGAAENNPEDRLLPDTELAQEDAQNYLDGQHHINTDTLRSLNGIPSHAYANDESLLRWMMVRRESYLKSGQLTRQVTPTIQEFLNSLKQVDSLPGLRRLIFQSLEAGLDVKTFGHAPPNLSVDLAREIRQVCWEILAEHDGDVSLRLETLAMIGNLSARLASRGVELGAPLRGLGLILSAEVGAIEASFRHLCDGLADHTWTELPGGSGDILSALEAYTSFLSLGLRNPAFGQVVDLQRVLQLVTGLDENNALAPESFRSLVLAYLEDARVPDSIATRAYLSYITVLGQLGALRTVWKESRISLPLLSERIGTKNELSPQMDTAALANQFLAAIQTSARVVVHGGDDATLDLDLEGCATLDYHALDAVEDLPANVGLSQEADNIEKPTKLQINTSMLGSALESPLHEWLAKIQSFSRA